MNAQHKEWLARAENDLQFAQIGLKEGFYAQVCFLSQQVIEKCLKGTLVALNRTYPKSHSLKELAGQVPELNLKNFYESLTIIDGYYTPIRYPDAQPGSKTSGPPNKMEADTALKTAQKIWNIVVKYLSKAG